jgi:hypothetical protein
LIGTPVEDSHPKAGDGNASFIVGGQLASPDECFEEGRCSITESNHCAASDV